MIRVTSLSYCCIYKKKKGKKHLSEQDRAASRANTQPSIEYYSVRKRFMLIL